MSALNIKHGYTGSHLPTKFPPPWDIALHSSRPQNDINLLIPSDILPPFKQSTNGGKDVFWVAEVGKELVLTVDGDKFVIGNKKVDVATSKLIVFL